MKKVIEKEKKEKDLRPIWIYVIFMFVIPVIAGFVLAFVNPSIAEGKTLDLISIGLSGILFIVFIWMYKDRYINDFKKLNKKTWIYVLGMSAALFLINYGLSDMFEKMKVTMNNQDTINEMFKSYKLLTSINVCLFAPFIEELIFRYSFSTFIKKDLVFILISSIVFGIMHGVGVVTFLYVFIGVMIAVVYLKTDKNIVASTVIHFINNFLSVIIMFMTIK